MVKKPSPNLIKAHMIHTPAEAAAAFDLHRQSILRWIKHVGLPAVRGGRASLPEAANRRRFWARAELQANAKPGQGRSTA